MEDVDDGRAFRLHIAKFSVGKRDRQPVWIARGKENPWSFRGFEMAGDPKEAVVIRKTTAEAKAVRLLWEYVRDHQDAAPQTLTVLRDAKPNGLAKNVVTTAIAQCLSAGYLNEYVLPAEQRKGGRQKGLIIADKEPPKNWAGCGRVRHHLELSAPTELDTSTTRPPYQEIGSGRVVGAGVPAPTPTPCRKTWASCGRLRAGWSS